MPQSSSAVLFRWCRPLCLALLLAGCAQAPLAPKTSQAAVAAAPVQPEIGSGWTDKPGWLLQHEAVAAAHPLAVDAGVEILRAGGNALDAAIAVQMVLTLVEPQSSGIGGGALLMLWDGQQLRAYDGRETAPQAADERLFLQPDGKPMALTQAIVGGRSVGTPGVLRMLALAHAREGRLPWARLFAPAIRLSEEGFAVSPRLHMLLADETALPKDALARRYFYDENGQAWPVGHRLRNPALAQLLRQIAGQGVEAFYQGPVAHDIVQRVHGHASNPGLLSEDDLKGYQALEREALCTDWRTETRAPWRLCGFPPPSSGHLTLMQILGMTPASNADQALVNSRPTADWLHRFTEASRLAFADRALYIGDPAFVQPPAGDWRSLLAPAYLQQRAALIGERSMGQAAPGQPAALHSSYAPMAAQPEYGTSHISIVDREGRAVSMTTTVESAFGSRLMSDGGTGLAGGFMLNNQLTDFAMQPRDAHGRPVANRVEPGKRPRSSMSPTLVFDPASGRLLMDLGSPGGQAIIHFVAKALIGVHDWGLDLQQAFALPNMGSYNGPTVLEAGKFPAATVQALQARGHQVLERDMTSGLQGMERRGEAWFGAADPRREGVVRGE